MELLWSLQKDETSLISSLPNDIVEFCIFPYLNYEMNEQNLLGFTFKDQKDTFFRACTREDAENLFSFILEKIGMNYVQYHSLQTFKGLNCEQLWAIFYLRSVRAYLKTYKQFHIPYVFKQHTDAKNPNVIFETLQTEEATSPRCPICKSLSHSASKCLKFVDKVYIRCGKHKMKHFLVRGKLHQYDKVPHWRDYIDDVPPGYVHCPKCFESKCFESKCSNQK